MRRSGARRPGRTCRPRRIRWRPRTSYPVDRRDQPEQQGEHQDPECDCNEVSMPRSIWSRRQGRVQKQPRRHTDPVKRSRSRPLRGSWSRLRRSDRVAGGGALDSGALGQRHVRAGGGRRRRSAADARLSARGPAPSRATARSSRRCGPARTSRRTSARGCRSPGRSDPEYRSTFGESLREVKYSSCAVWRVSSSAIAISGSGGLSS